MSTCIISWLKCGMAGYEYKGICGYGSGDGFGFGDGRGFGRGLSRGNGYSKVGLCEHGYGLGTGTGYGSIDGSGDSW